MNKLKASVFIFFFWFTSMLAPAQTFIPDSLSYRYWIYFKDKGAFKPGNNIQEGTEEYKITATRLSSRTIWRRSKVLPPDQIVGYDDIDVDGSYVEQIKNTGVRLVAVSRWFNAVSVKARRKQLEIIKKLPFVAKIEGVHLLEQVTLKNKITPRSKLIQSSNISGKMKYNYGQSFWQNEQMNVPILHYCGITGYGVIVGMCDDGFNWRKHESLQSKNVIAEHDWIFGDDSTQFQFPPNQYPADEFEQDNHGTSTLSTLGGFYEGKLIGPAFESSFLLSKTEYDGSETPVEEDYWLEAVEWIEANGADVISSSLIYKPFDLPNNSYDYKDMNGKTTIIARAASFAVRLGVVVCNSMGNERQTNPPSIVSPPDADSVISVGAVDSAGQIAYFSSNGPNSDGRTKPDVVAMGVDVWTAVSQSYSLNDTSYSFSSGTSFSCPLTAGVCALILSAHPELTPVQVANALRNTGDKKNTPDNVYGWGLVNALEAALYSGIIISNKPEIRIENEVIYVNVFVVSNNQILPGDVRIFYSLDGSNDFKESEMSLVETFNETNSGKYNVVIHKGSNFDMLKLYITARDAASSNSIPYKSPERFFYTTDGIILNTSY